MTYQDAAAKLTGRNSQRRKVGNNTYLERRSESTIALRLHNTDIILFQENGNVIVSTYNANERRTYHTVTTKARLNDFLPHGWYISQSKGQWYIGKRGNWEHIAVFADGMTFHADGETYSDAAPLEDATVAQKLRRKVAKYSKAYIQALSNGEVPAPSHGDCWGCLMVATDGSTPMGGREHILSHIEENYFVPSLLVRAIERHQVSQVAKWALASHWSADQAFKDLGSMAKFGYEQLQKSLYRYCLGELGQAS